MIPPHIGDPEPDDPQPDNSLFNTSWLLYGIPITGLAIGMAFALYRVCFKGDSTPFYWIKERS